MQETLEVDADDADGIALVSARRCHRPQYVEQWIAWDKSFHVLVTQSGQPDLLTSLRSTTFLWAPFKAKAYANKPRTFGKLKEHIRDEIRATGKRILRTVTVKISPWLQECIAWQGDHLLGAKKEHTSIFNGVLLLILRRLCVSFNPTRQNSDLKIVAVYCCTPYRRYIYIYIIYANVQECTNPGRLLYAGA